MQLLWLLVFVLGSLSGCASLSEQQCLDAGATSWEGVGYQDGYNGHNPDQQLEQHQQACSGLGILPQRESYMIGWSRGIREYCTPQRGYSIGLSGSRGNGELCPDGTGILFEDNVELGLRVYGLKREMAAIYYEIEDLEERLDQAGVDKHERRKIRQHIRHRDDQLSHLRWQLMEAQSTPLISF